MRLLPSKSMSFETTRTLVHTWLVDVFGGGDAYLETVKLCPMTVSSAPQVVWMEILGVSGFDSMRLERIWDYTPMY